MATPINQRTIENWNNAKEELITAAEKVGIDPKILVQIAGFESGFDSTAKPIARDASKNTQTQYDGTKAISTAHGYGQFLNSTWHEVLRNHGKTYGIEDLEKITRDEANTPKYRENTALQAELLAEFTKENIILGEKLGGSNPSANVYVLHNLGGYDGPRFLKNLRDNPNEPVSTILSSAVINGNSGLYKDGSITFVEAYERMGRYMNEAEVYVKNMYSDVPLEYPTNTAILKLGSEGDNVYSYQQQLKEAGYLVDITGRYDQKTFDATQQLQKDNFIKSDGVVSSGTYVALNATLNQGKSSIVKEITNKLANIQALNEKLNDPIGEKLLSEADQVFFGRDILLTSHEGDMAQLGGYLAKLGLVEENSNTENILSAINQFERTNNLSQDNTNWSETLSALKDQYITHQKDEVTNEIQTERQAMAQLELDRITDINEQQTKLTTDKAELTDDIALKGAQIIALQGLQENFANNASNDNVANNPLSETAMSLLNKNTLNLNNDKTGEVTDLKQLQTVLKEEGYLKGKADGLWGNDTEQALAKATGLTQDNVKALVTTDLGQDGKGQVIDPKIMESGRLEALRSQYLESKVSQLTLSKTELENKSMGIDDKLSILDTQRPSIIEQNIVSEQLKINQLQENIRDYDKTHIEPLAELQAQLSNHINDPTPYQSVKDELSAANISLLTSEQQSLMDSSALLKQNGKTNNIDNVQSVQSFLIEQGYLDATWKDKQGVEHPSNDGNFGGGTHKAIVAYQTEKGLNADGVVGKDFRAAMKEDIYSNLSIDDLNQRIEVEMAARIEGKETKIAELSSSINQSELRIGQLQSEQKTMIATQQSLQQSQESKEPVVSVEGKQNILDTAFNLSTQRSDVSIESGAKGAILNVGNQQCSMDFCKVKNFEHYANGNNTLLGKLNDDDQFKIFHRSGGKLNEVATIDDFSKQNLVALEESVRTQGLAQGRNQDQGREA